MSNQISPRVFITQQPRANKQGWVPNLTPASKYGALHFVFTGSDKPSQDPDGAIFQAGEALADFNPKKDYLLWPNSGDPAAIMAVMIVLARMDITRICFLNWERKLVKGQRDQRQGFYAPVTFTLPSLSSN